MPYKEGHTTISMKQDLKDTLEAFMQEGWSWDYYFRGLLELIKIDWGKNNQGKDVEEFIKRRKELKHKSI